MKRRKVFVTFVMILTLAVISGAYAATRANDIIDTASVTLSASTKKATFSMRTKVDCAELSVTSYALYKSNGVVVTSGSISSTASSMRYFKTADFSSYIFSGNSYYVSAVFNADGETRSVSSSTVSY